MELLANIMNELGHIDEDTVDRLTNKLPVRKKLEVLLLNESLCNEIAVKKCYQMLRMQSTIVSYDINDSIDYYFAGQMKNLLHDGEKLAKKQEDKKKK